MSRPSATSGSRGDVAACVSRLGERNGRAGRRIPMERGGLGSDPGDRRLSPPDARRNARGGIGTVFLVSASPEPARATAGSTPPSKFLIRARVPPLPSGRETARRSRGRGGWWQDDCRLFFHLPSVRPSILLLLSRRVWDRRRLLRGGVSAARRPPRPNPRRGIPPPPRRTNAPSTGSIRACAARRVRSSPPTIVGDGPTPPKSTDPPAVASSSFRVRKFVVVSERKFVVVRDDRPPTDRPRPRRPKPSSGRSGRFPRPTTRPEIVAADGAARRCHVRPRAPR